MVSGRQAEGCEQVTQMLPSFAFIQKERNIVIRLLQNHLQDRSAIVKACAMQVRAKTAPTDEGLRPTIVRALEQATATGTPAMRAARGC